MHKFVVAASCLNLTFQTNDGPVHALKDVNPETEKEGLACIVNPAGSTKKAPSIYRLTGAIAAALVSSACALPNERALTARSDAVAERWVGTAQKLSDTRWELVVSSDEGRTCRGEATHDPSRRLEGQFNCDDGSSGDLGVLFNNHRGFGTMRVGDTTFTATIGDP